MSFVALALRARATNDTTRAQINNIPSKSHFIPLLACCHQPCHTQCVSPWKKVRHTISCPHCRQVIPITVLEVTYPQLWKEDAYFVERVKNVWKDNRFWYGIGYDEFGSKEGIWGELKDPYEPNRKTVYFLGHTKRQVIPRMNTCLSFL